MSEFLDKKIETIQGFAEFLDGKHLPPHPINVFLEVSNLCNMSCFMCVLFSSLNQTRTSDITSKERGFLKYDEISRKLAKIAPHMLSVHLFGYGEPTIHPNFRAFVEFFSKYEVMIDFFTNGMKLDQDLAAFLVEKNVFNVTFSFSGATREEYENVYLGGNFDTVTGNIRRLAEEKRKAGKKYPQIQINSIAFQHHVDKFEQFVELMGSIGVDEIAVKPLQEYGDKIDELQGHAGDFKSETGSKILARATEKARRLNVRLWIHPDLVSKSIEAAPKASNLIPISEIKKIAQSKKVPGPKAEKLPDVPSPLATMSKTSTEMLLGETIPAPKGFSCPEPFHTLYIAQDGSVRPCCFWSSFSPALGSLKKNAAEEIWQGTGVQTMQTLALQGRYPKKGCGHCIERNLAPFDHHPWYFIREYRDWSEATFGPSALTEIGLETNKGVSHGRVHLLMNKPEMVSKPGTNFVDVWDLCRTVTFSHEAFHEYFEGQVDVVDESGLWGWVLFKRNKDLKLPIEIRTDSRILSRSTAYGYREDLKQAGIGDGRFGFSLSMEGKTLDELVGLKVRIEGTDWEVPLSEVASARLTSVMQAKSAPLETQAMK